MRRYLAIAIGLLLAALWFLLGQVRKGSAKVHEIERELERVESSRKLDRELTDIQTEHREKANEDRQRREERPADQRPSGAFGRLHDDNKDR